MRATLDEVIERSTDGRRGDECGFELHQRPMAADERFADCDSLVILFVFALGIGNFTLHKAVLESGHPFLAQLAGLVKLLGGRGSLALEFVVLVAAMLLVAGGQSGWAWIYLGYSALNALAAWLILSGRV